MVSPGRGRGHEASMIPYRAVARRWAVAGARTRAGVERWATGGDTTAGRGRRGGRVPPMEKKVGGGGALQRDGSHACL